MKIEYARLFLTIFKKLPTVRIKTNTFNMKQHLQQIVIFLLSMVVISLGLIIIPIGVFTALSKFNQSIWAYFTFILVYSILLTFTFHWLSEEDL